MAHESCAGYAVGMSTRRLSRTFALGIALYTVPACEVGDGRLALAELRCDDADCEARWDGTAQWSPVHKTSAVLDLEDIDPSDVWPCSPDPDVDLCAIVDVHGRRGCFRIEGAWAVAVAPACAVAGWLDVGEGMAALAR